MSKREFAALLATRCSPYALSADQLTREVETTNVREALSRLIERLILQPFKGYTTEGKLGIVYGYASNNYAQRIYCRVHSLSN